MPRLEAAPGKTVRMQIKARDVMIARQPEAMSALNVIEATVAEIGPMDGPGVEIRLDCPAKRWWRGSHAIRSSGFRSAPARRFSPSSNRCRSDVESLGAAWRDIRAADAATAPH